MNNRQRWLRRKDDLRGVWHHFYDADSSISVCSQLRGPQERFERMAVETMFARHCTRCLRSIAARERKPRPRRDTEVTQ